MRQAFYLICGACILAMCCAGCAGSKPSGDRLSRLEMARADEAEAQALLERSFIRSPIDGIVLRRLRRTGEAVSDQPPTPILWIGDRSHLRVRAEIDETDVAEVRLGQRAYVTADAYGEQQFWGTIIRVGERMGRKMIQTDRPAERVDTQVLEVLIDLNRGTSFPIGLRVDVFIVAPTDA